MASYRGAATISAIAVPPTGTHPDFYHKPLRGVARSNFEIDTGKRKIKPYDPTIGQQIADMLRPSMGEPDPDRSGGDRRGLRPVAGGSRTPRPRPNCSSRRASPSRATTGTCRTASRFTITLMVEGEARPVMTRAGSMIAQQWRQLRHRRHDRRRAGARCLTRRNGGDFETIISWSVETWGGHPDLVVLPRQLALRSSSPSRARSQPPRNWQRWSNPSSTRSSSRSARSPSTIRKGIELGQEYVKLVVREMPIIPLMSYNVFTVMDQTYWTGYPTADDPVHQSGPELGNSRYMMVKLKPAAQ